jgi:hypothetical protein
LYDGFDVEERDGQLFASAVGDVCFAMKPSEAGLLNVCFEANAPGALCGFGETLPFVSGRNELRLRVSADASTRFAEAMIIPQRFVFETSAGSARLLTCAWSER